MDVKLNKEEILKILFKKINLDQTMGWFGCCAFFLSLVSGLLSGWAWFFKMNIEPKAISVFIVVGLLGIISYVWASSRMTD